MPGQIKTYTLDTKQLATLKKLAASNDFFKGLDEKYTQYKSLSQKQYDALRNEMAKENLPKLPAHDGSGMVGVNNKILRDSKPVCRRCNELAKVAVGKMGVCKEHIAEQQQAEADYAAQRAAR